MIMNNHVLLNKYLMKQYAPSEINLPANSKSKSNSSESFIPEFKPKSISLI